MKNQPPIIFTLFFVCMSMGRANAETIIQPQKQHRTEHYQYKVTGEGKGYTDCENFAKMLNKLAEEKRDNTFYCPQARHSVFPQFKNVPWERLDFEKNLELVFRLEQLSWQQVLDRKPQSYDQWLIKVRGDIANGKTAPRLFLTRLLVHDACRTETGCEPYSIPEGVPLTLLGYQRGGDDLSDANWLRCVDEHSEPKPGVVEKIPSALMLFVFNEETKQVHQSKYLPLYTSSAVNIVQVGKRYHLMRYGDSVPLGIYGAYLRRLRITYDDGVEDKKWHGWTVFSSLSNCQIGAVSNTPAGRLQ